MSQKTSNVEHVFLRLGTFVHLFGEMPIISFTYFCVILIKLLHCKSLQVLDASPFEVRFLNMFFHSGLSFHFVGTLCSTNIFNVDKLRFVFPFVAYTFGVVPRKPLFNPRA